MKIAVINFSGNVGKSTVARNMLFPRIKDADFVSVESINWDGGSVDAIRGKEFGSLSEKLMMRDAAIIDVGSSNVEDFMRLMGQYHGSHDDIDLFIVPTVKERKQMSDTIATIQALSDMGVGAKKIRVVFNRVESDDDIEKTFYPLIDYHQDTKAFTLRTKAAVHYSELYQRMGFLNTSITELLLDNTDYKAVLKDAKTEASRTEAAARISMKRLAASAQANLDAVFNCVVAK